MVEVEQELRALASYFNVSCGKLVIDPIEKVPVLKTKTGTSIRGLVSIAKQLTRSSEAHTHLKGTSVDERAAIDQWLEYRVTKIDRSVQEKDVNVLIKELDAYLVDKIYFVGYQPTLADILIYCGLHQIYSEMTFYEKEKHMHLSRWFNNIQHQMSLNLKLSTVTFQKNLIYSSVH